ncbi:DUF1559 domain-containing protein [bacterium]|nr:DUF1559 domain-containing protein [bacterium]
MAGSEDDEQRDSDTEKPSPVANRSLWDVMRADEAEVSGESEPAEPGDTEKVPNEAPRPRGLWSVIEHGTDAATEANLSEANLSEDAAAGLEADENVEFATADESDADSIDSDGECGEFDSASETDDDSTEAMAAPDAGPLPFVTQEERSGRDRSDHRRVPSHGNTALLLGSVSVVTSLLCLLSLAALRILPTLIGVAALIYGCLGLAAQRRSSTKSNVGATLGLGLGLLGIFAGPLWLNEFGDRWRHEQTSRVVTAHLQSIGSALDAFYNEHQRFPAGGSFVDSSDGFPVGMHGWMTDLLPHLGYQELATQIDHRRPWSDPVNADPMSTRVEPFLTPGTPYALTATGHAPAHFAGVGGRVETEFGTGDLGIFGRNSQVTHDDVIDGLSQTMAAGEIAQTIPAWGEPDNWRSIGPGLNQSPQGFGNASDTGAHFLMADGSVRFLSNRTSLHTLQQLSTRNGSERTE